MKQYLDLLQRIRTEVSKKVLTGTRTISVFGHQMRFNLEEFMFCRFVTTKKLPFEIDYPRTTLVMKGVPM